MLGPESESRFLVPESESESGLLNFINLESVPTKKQGLRIPDSVPIWTLRHVAVSCSSRAWSETIAVAIGVGQLF